MRLQKLFLAALAVGLFSTPVWAFHFDLNGIYLTDATKTTAESTSTRTYYDVGLGFNLDKKGMFFGGWDVTSVNSSEVSSGITTTFSTFDMGPELGGFFDRARAWSLSVAYHLVATAAYTTAGGSAETWKGTSLKVEFGYAPEITPEFFAGLKIAYYAGNFVERLIGSANYTQVAYTKTFILPTIYLSYRL